MTSTLSYRFPPPDMPPIRTPPLDPVDDLEWRRAVVIVHGNVDDVLRTALEIAGFGFYLCTSDTEVWFRSDISVKGGVNRPRPHTTEVVS